ncbi:MAG: ATP-grasp domain-containing protein [Lachnospiraceae bacterium]|nr:ATP-grasp domain-containing protein [Lachnospiraceae bacterium]
MEGKNVKNIAVIGASYLQLPLIEKAKDMGFTTHVFAWKADDVGERAADYFYPISIVEKEAILEKCREIGICGICSIASDLAVITVDYVAAALGLTGNTPECTRNCTNKYYMRKALMGGGDPVPRMFSPEKDEKHGGNGISYPVIVKPTDRSGSRGVTIVRNAGEFDAALTRALSESFEKKAVVEEYIEGDEYSLEGMSWMGRHRILAMTKKYTSGPPHFIETGHMEPAPVDEDTRLRAEKTVIHALSTLGIRYGASHSEIKIRDDGSIWIIEIGARMGGDCIGSDLVPASCGIDYVKAVIETACGTEPDLTASREGTPAAVCYIMREEDEIRMNEFRRLHPEHFTKLVYLDRAMYGRTTDSSNRAGCYIYTPL